MMTEILPPDELRLSADKALLTVVFGEQVYDLTAEYLRVCSPSAEVRGHGGEWQWVAGKQGISIYRIKPVGNYAVQLIFSDGHDSGIYTWAVLHDLATRHAYYWTRYLEALAATGKSRTPHPNRRTASGCCGGSCHS